MNITVTDITGDLVYIIPHVPANIEITSDSDNETMETLAGPIRLVGEDGLKQASWSALFPVNKNYSWQKLGSLIDGYDYIKFFDTMKKNKIPIRVVITDDSLRSLLNCLMSIDTFTYKKDKTGDYAYSIALTEFPEDKWEFLNDQIKNQSYYSDLSEKSEAKKALQKHGLL